MSKDHTGPNVTRRRVIGALATLPVLGPLGGSLLEALSGAPAPASGPAQRARRATAPRPSVVVVGAGAFGGWTALHLLRRGARVTLIDAWQPGHPRASSGGETRVIRGMYGADKPYVDMVVRSFELWRDAERRFGRQFYHPTGALWLFRGDDQYGRTSLPLLRAAGLPARELSIGEAEKKYPGVSFAGVKSVMVEERAGYLTARQACEAVRAAFVREGGTWRQAVVKPPTARGAQIEKIELADGSTISADRFVFACGPWMGAVLPELIGDTIFATRQDVFYFGPPGGETRYDEGRFPVWVDLGERIFYGIPGNERRGFKVADDTRGVRVDPTTMERTPDPDALARARAQLAERFPGMAKAPLVLAEVCQYENSPDGHFIVDRLADLENAWVAGGGSGHGFKLSPALGEHVAGLVMGTARPIPLFNHARLAAVRGRTTTQIPR